jgi:hypothetical protein
MDNKTIFKKKEEKNYIELFSKIKHKKYIFKNIIKYYLNDYMFWEHIYSFTYKIYYNRFYRNYCYKNIIYNYLLKLWDLYFINIFKDNKYYKDFLDSFFWSYEDNYSLSVENGLYITTSDFIEMINLLLDFLSYEHFKENPKFYKNIYFKLYYPYLL